VFEGDGLTASGQTLTPGAGLGDLRFVPKLLIARTRGRSLQLALGLAAPVTFPTGDDLEMRGYGGVTVEPRFLAGLLWRRFGLNFSVGYLINTADPPEALPIGNELTFGAGATLAVTKTLDLTVEAVGGAYLGENGPGLAEVPLELLGWLIFRPHSDWQIYLGAGPGLTNGIGSPDFRVV